EPGDLRPLCPPVWGYLSDRRETALAGTTAPASARAHGGASARRPGPAPAVSPFEPELQGLLDDIAENAALACGADDAAITLVDSDRLPLVAHYGPIPFVAWGGAVRPDSTVGRAFLERRTVHVRDIAEVPPESLGSQERLIRAGVRTVLAT